MRGTDGPIQGFYQGGSIKATAGAVPSMPAAHGQGQQGQREQGQGQHQEGVPQDADIQGLLTLFKEQEELRWKNEMLAERNRALKERLQDSARAYIMESYPRRKNDDSLRNVGSIFGNARATRQRTILPFLNARASCVSDTCGKERKGAGRMGRSGSISARAE